MKKILIVDDEFLIRYSLSQMLGSASVEVVSVTTGSEALQEIAASSFDLCCLDIHLPDMSGMEIMKKIKETDPDMKIIMMTGGTVNGPMLKDIEKNSELLLSKPFDLFRVKSFVERILETGSSVYRDEAGQIRDYKAFEYWLMNDQRRHERRPVARRVAYSSLSAHREEEQTAELIDISEGGMCLMTTYLLPTGVVLRICNNMTDSCTGTVRWSMQSGSGNLYRAGIQFMQSGEQQFPRLCKKENENKAEGA